MKITFLTLFPQFYSSFLDTSIIKRAISREVVNFETIDIRSFTHDAYKRVDDRPTGGGAGLIMKCQPIYDALESCRQKNSYVISMSPRGKKFTQEDAIRFKGMEHIIMIAGHYEGIDSRINNYVDEEISIGDYVLTGGELATLVISDAVTRLLDGAISQSSTDEESFDNGLLEYDQYTFPYDFRGDKIPDILFSGNHEAIKKYRQKEALKITRKLRPDLFKLYHPTKSDLKLLQELDNNIVGEWEKSAIEKGKKFIK